MNKFSFTIILIIGTSALFFIRCQKEYSYEGGSTNGSSGGTAPIAQAVFTLSGAPGFCNNHVINGTCYEGRALTNNNTSILNVDVTSAGAYSVSTDTLDGISFSKSGCKFSG